MYIYIYIYRERERERERERKKVVIFGRSDKMINKWNSGYTNTQTRDSVQNIKSSFCK